MMKRLLRRRLKRSSARKTGTRWSATPLEPRQMLAGDASIAGQVIINAAGTTGEEEFELLIAGEVVGSYQAGTELAAYRFESDQAIDPSDVSVRFVNDLYKPEEDFDRNLFVDNVEIGGVTYESESADTFSTGVWLAADGAAVPGFGRGDTLHTNGVFQYRGTVSNDVILLNDEIWQPIEGRDAVRMEEFDVILGPTTGEAGIWRFVDLQPGEATLSLTGEFVDADNSGITEVYFGIDYFNADGVISAKSSGIYQVVDSNTTQSVESLVPADATAASVWVVVNGKGQIGEFRVDSVDIENRDFSGDTTPPSARLITEEVTINTNDPFPSPPSYVVQLSDDGLANRIATTTGQIVLRDPNGNRVDSPIYTGFDGTDENTRNIVLGIGPQNITPLAGQYTVELLAGALTDAAGNASQAVTLGTFDVVLDDGVINPDDTTPPAVELTTASVDSDQREFVIRATDSQSEIGFGSGAAQSISVVGPNGQDVPVFGIAGGRGETERELFEVFTFPGNRLAAGTYSVFVEQGYVIDINNTPNAGGLIGTFEYLVLGESLA